MVTSRIIPDPSLVLLIGPAGAGKSTFAARHFRPTEIVSSDHCRALISDDEGDQSVTRAAFSLLHHIVRERLRLGRLTVVDATNLQTSARYPLLRMAHFFGLPVIAIVFKVSLETCLTRNLTRHNRQVIEEAIRKHVQELDYALRRLAREGYAQIWVLNEAEIGSLTITRASREAAARDEQQAVE